MSLQKIRQMVQQGEGEMIEFKRKVAHPEKIIREIVAFANTSGGNLLIGVDDNGTIPGIKFAEEEMYVLEKAIEKWCRPHIAYKAEIVPVTGSKFVVSYHIPESDRKPHYIIEEGTVAVMTGKNLKQRSGKKWGQAYVRFEDKSLQASREMWQILRRKRKEKDIKFNFGEKEKMLMQYLDQHTSVTVRQFAEAARLPIRNASQTLVLLVLANVLKVIPREKEDIYILKFS